MIYGGYFDIENKKIKIKELEARMSETDFWNDSKESSNVIENLNSLKSVVKDLDSLLNRVSDLKVLFSSSDIDEETTILVEEEINLLSEEIERNELRGPKYHQFCETGICIRLQPRADRGRGFTAADGQP